MQQTQLTFFTNIGAKKPNSIRNKETSCPFCDRSQLEEILDEQGSIILVKNKFPVLDQAFQTVLIETDQCNGELSYYDKEHLHKLFYFGIGHWQKMKREGGYRSVMFFKNHGPLSGGTISHPHMQIVGLKDVDCQYNVHSWHFDGVEVMKKDGVTFTVSSQPRVGFHELNVRLDDRKNIEGLADAVQAGTHFLMNHFHPSCQSYNLFFYELKEIIYAKLIPRFVTSPLYIGYSVQQVASNIGETAEKIKKLYYSEN